MFDAGLLGTAFAIIGTFDFLTSDHRIVRVAKVALFARTDGISVQEPALGIPALTNDSLARIDALAFPTLVFFIAELIGFAVCILSAARLSFGFANAVGVAEFSFGTTGAARADLSAAIYDAFLVGGTGAVTVTAHAANLILASLSDGTHRVVHTRNHLTTEDSGIAVKTLSAFA